MHPSALRTSYLMEQKAGENEPTLGFYLLKWNDVVMIKFPSAEKTETGRLENVQYKLVAPVCDPEFVRVLLVAYTWTVHKQRHPSIQLPLPDELRAAINKWRQRTRN